MQFGFHRHPGPRPRGPAGWIPPLLVAVTSSLVTIALVYFILIVSTLRDRIPLPPTTIPLAMAAAGLVALVMLVRAVHQFREAWRGYKGAPEDDKPRR